MIDAGHLFRHRVFDLDARVALDEAVLAAFGYDEKLDGTGIHVFGGLHQPDRIGRDALAQRIAQIRRRRDFDDLLVAQLHRTIAFVQMDDVAVRVGQHLHFDVPRSFDQLFDEQRAVAESGFRLAATARVRLAPFRLRCLRPASRARRRPPML